MRFEAVPDAVPALATYLAKVNLGTNLIMLANIFFIKYQLNIITINQFVYHCCKFCFFYKKIFNVSFIIKSVLLISIVCSAKHADSIKKNFLPSYLNSVTYKTFSMLRRIYLFTLRIIVSSSVVLSYRTIPSSQYLFFSVRKSMALLRQVVFSSFARFMSSRMLEGPHKDWWSCWFRP